MSVLLSNSCQLSVEEKLILVMSAILLFGALPSLVECSLFVLIVEEIENGEVVFERRMGVSWRTYEVPPSDVTTILGGKKNLLLLCALGFLPHLSWRLGVSFVEESLQGTYSWSRLVKYDFILEFSFGLSPMQYVSVSRKSFEFLSWDWEPPLY